MYEIRIHGLGGQGVVTMTNILALAAFYEGWHVQAFPFFGPERTGAPVTGFVRLNRELIKLKQQIYSPDLIIILNDALFDKKVKVAEGAKPNAKLLINSQLNLAAVAKLADLPAKDITLCQTANSDNKSTNMFVLGCAIKNFNLASLNNYLKAIKENMSDKNKTIINNNLLAAKNGYEQTGETTA